ncbi:MAG: hypothetical protein ACRD6N_12605 [Pyrinomonadaceae bacterium]
MKSLFLFMATLGMLSLFAGDRSSAPDFELQTLHEIKEVTLSPADSGRSSEEFAKGYEETALFLSNFAKRSPDLLFNGACGSDDYFQASTAGDDMSLIADLGANVSLDEISASGAFNVQRVHSYQSYSKFVSSVKVEAGHTYAVLLNANGKRGLFVFTVTDYVRNKKVTLRYAVKSYQITSVQISSPGFQWDQKSAF